VRFGPATRLWPALLTGHRTPSGTRSAYVGGVTELPGGVAADQVRQLVGSAREPQPLRSSTLRRLRLWCIRCSAPPTGNARCDFAGYVGLIAADQFRLGTGFTPNSGSTTR